MVHVAPMPRQLLDTGKLHDVITDVMRYEVRIHYPWGPLNFAPPPRVPCVKIRLFRQKLTCRRRSILKTRTERQNHRQTRQLTLRVAKAERSQTNKFVPSKLRATCNEIIKFNAGANSNPKWNGKNVHLLMALFGYRLIIQLFTLAAGYLIIL